MVIVPGQAFCGHECWVQYNVQTGTGGAVRKHLFELEHGVCQLCGLDCHALCGGLLKGSNWRCSVGKQAPTHGSGSGFFFN
jgi:hypothetical protein